MLLVGFSAFVGLLLLLCGFHICLFVLGSGLSVVFLCALVFRLGLGFGLRSLGWLLLGNVLIDVDLMVVYGSLGLGCLCS